MRLLTVILGVIGVVAALAGIWSLFLNWLNLLGVLVPPLGAIIIMDQLVLRRETVDDSLVSWRPTAFFSWAFAAGVALLVNSQAPQLSVAVCGIVVAVVAYTAATLPAGRRRAPEPEAALSRDAT